MNNFLLEDERLDDLEIKGLKIIQNSKKFCFGIDAVLLSDFAKIKKNSLVIDFCTGNGIIPLLLSAKYEPKKINALELQDDIVDMARRSILYNKLENLISIENGNIKNIKDIYGPQSVNVVTCNPPYMEDLSALKNTKESLAVARHEVECNLEDVIYATKYVLKQGGVLYMVHRPNRLVGIMSILAKYKMEVKRLRFVHSKKDKKANLLLIEAIKGGGAWLDIESPLFVYNEDASYTDEILKIYGKI